MTNHKCTANPNGVDHEWDDYHRCKHCGDNEADWWYDHRELIMQDLVPAPELTDGAG